MHMSWSDADLSAHPTVFHEEVWQPETEQETEGAGWVRRETSVGGVLFVW